VTPTLPRPLTVEQLKKCYRKTEGEPFCAVKNVSFFVERGECLGLLGPNGAGKSTTMRCVTGFYPPTEGMVRIFGIDVQKQPREARAEMGVCVQEETLDTDFSVFSQMVRYATFFRISVKEGERRAQELLERFGLWDKRKDHIESLSGGMKRRLQVARALISHPKLLILDEPTTGLDPEARRSLWDILVDLRRHNVSMLLSTHYMEEAERLCDRVAIIHRGEILDTASPQDLIAKHVGTAEVTEEVRPGVVWRRPPNLEDVYLKLTGGTLQAHREDAS
jgi:lipooligosaccharide transport system ATP-binding protein